MRGVVVDLSEQLAETIRLLLGSGEGAWTLCRDCGAVKHSGDEHRCRAHVEGARLEAEGLIHDDKRRAKSYAIE